MRFQRKQTGSSGSASQSGSRRVLDALAALCILLGFGLRIVTLDTPSGFFCDEASTAFNARSILETGRDEHGKRFPVYFKAFGEYKPGLYIYSTAAVFALFGESDAATRLTALIVLSLFTIVLYRYCAEFIHPGAGLLAVVLLQTTPWLNHFAHIAFELSAIPLLLALALLFWQRGISKRPEVLPVSALFFSLAVYTYPTARLFVPLLVAALFAIHYSRLLSPSYRAPLGAFFCLTALSAIPFAVYVLFEPGFLSRVDYLNVFSTPFIERSSSYQMLQDSYRSLAGQPDAELAEAIGDGAARLGTFLVNYLRYLSPSYLFLSGDRNLRFGNSHFGVMSYVEGIGVILGLLFILARRSKRDRELLAWLLLYPVAGALTWEDVPHSGRGIVAQPALTLIAVMGLWQTGQLLWRSSRLRKMVLPALVTALVILHGWFSVRYFGYYLRHYSKESAGWMQDGFRETMKKIEARHAQYERVLLVSTFLHYQPGIFVLYYSGASPARWRETKTLPWRVTVQTSKLRPSEIEPGVLYVLSPVPDRPPPHLREIDRVYYTGTKEPAFGFYEYAGTNSP